MNLRFSIFEAAPLRNASTIQHKARKLVGQLATGLRYLVVNLSSAP
jgi:hypothetical protein